MLRLPLPPSFLARHYNNAMLSIEINNHGLTVQAEAQRNYWNFYRWQYFDRIGGKGLSLKVGWETNIGTKPILVDRSVACVRSGLVSISSSGLLGEMWKFVKVPGTMSFESEAGHDDRVMAFMIALTTLYIETPDAHFATGEPLQPGFLQPKKELPTTIGDAIMPNPLWDSTDPRSGRLVISPDWRLL